MKIIPVRHITDSNRAAYPGQFKIRQISAILSGKDLQHDLHRHDFYFVMAIEKGEGVHEIDFVRHTVTDRSLFILRPGQVHKLELKSVSTGFLLEFDAAFYQPKDSAVHQRLVKASAKNACVTDSDGIQRSLGLLSNIANEFTLKQEGFVEIILAELDIFFIEFLRQSKHAAGALKAGNSYSLERYEDFMTLLEKNISTSKKVVQYAEWLNLSGYQLNTITKSIIGKTASDLINDQIILEAKRCLLATTAQVKEIADLLGYEDISYFIRFFKKHTGHTPEAFRKNFK